jgi:hypothetical protein
MESFAKDFGGNDRSQIEVLSWNLPGRTELITWLIDPMLGNDRERNETTAVARQQPALRD